MPRRPEGVDTSVPNIARMYDYYLGGKDNFEADRVAAEEIIRLVPVARTEAMTNRQFLRLAVRYLATDAGISQFLDIGVGLPTQGAVHEVAREVSDGARVAYVDYARSSSPMPTPCSPSPIAASPSGVTCASPPPCWPIR
jgi:hypothetical protein